MFEKREKYLTVRQVAANRNVSTDFVRRRFRNEKGVLVLSQPKPGKRIYEPLRIPESVEARVFGSWTNG